MMMYFSRSSLTIVDIDDERIFIELDKCVVCHSFNSFRPAA